MYVVYILFFYGYIDIFLLLVRFTFYSSKMMVILCVVLHIGLDANSFFISYPVVIYVFYLAFCQHIIYVWVTFSFCI